MKNSKAIKILQLQIDKLKNDVSNRSYNWTNETRAYIIEFFGESSSQNDYFKYFNSWWILVPSINDTLPKTIEQQEKDVMSFLESCINVIKNIGVAKKTKQNFLHTVDSAYIIGIITLIVSAAFFVGNQIGIYSEKNENNKLNTEVSNLQIELNNCKGSNVNKPTKKTN